MKVALVCDWLTTPGGAEKVLLELHRLYPEAPIYTSQYSKKGIDWFNDATVKTGWLQIFPAGLRKFLGPLRQIYFSHLDLSEYDLVISVTGAEAKAIKTWHTKPRRTSEKRPISSLYHTSAEKSSANAYHVCYCHVPTQYYWQMYDRYVENPGFGLLSPVVWFFFKLLVKPLRAADYKSAQQPDQFVTISEYAREQIEKYYQREAVIIAPPVEVEKFAPDFSTKNHKLSTNNSEISTENRELSTKSEDFSTSFPQVFHKFQESFPQYYIIACRQVNWKRVDLAIKACRELQLPLLVVGDGPEHQKLRELAGEAENIRFLPWAATTELAQYLQNAKGYIFPSLEPFGIAAVEALAASCPVLAYREGGSQDFIKPGENGLLFDAQTPESLTQALQKFDQMQFDRAKVSQTAQKFSVKNFDQQICKLVKKEVPKL